MVKRTVVLLLITVLCACVTPQKSQFSMLIDKWVGRSADELAVRNGPPEEIFMLDSGGKIYSYLKSQMAERNSETKADIVNPDRLYREDIAREDIRTSNPYTLAPPLPILGPGTPYANSDLRPKPVKRKNSCKLLFKISDANIIESWSADGAGCE